MSSDTTIAIPVTGRMVLQQDGTWKMVDATYITASTDAFVRWLLAAFHIPTTQGDIDCGQK